VGEDLFGPGSAPSPDSGRTSATVDEFPWIVAVNGSTRCSGIRVASQTIVTVAHCGRVFGVFAGARAPFQPLYLNPQGGLRRHATLDVLTAALSTNVAYRPAPPLLTDAQLEAFSNRPLRAIGFGRAGRARELSYGEVQLVHARCKGASLANYACDEAEFVTTNLRDGSLVPGDSGGAVLATDGSRWYLAGMILRRHNPTNHLVHLRMPPPMRVV
jgi:trypsin